MKKVVVCVIPLISLIFFLFCGKEEGGVTTPSGFSISADTTGTKVVLKWNAVDADSYIIYFKAIGDPNFSRVAATTSTSYTYDPNGKNGEYYITAMKDGEESPPTSIKSTIPVHTQVQSVYELEASGNTGYGWDRSSGTGGTYSMTEAGNADFVDIYISNWNDDPPGGPWSSPYYILSPDQVVADKGNTGFVPDTTWKLNGILSITMEEADSIVPAGGNYQASQDYIANQWYAVHTEDNYYAVIKTSGLPNETQGYVQIESWFQPVKGLRILDH